MLWIVLFAVSMAGVSFLVRRAVEKGDAKEREAQRKKLSESDG